MRTKLTRAQVFALGRPRARGEEAIAVVDDAADDVLGIVRTRPVALLARHEGPVPLGRAHLLVEADAGAVVVVVLRAGPADVGEGGGGEEEDGRECRDLHPGEAGDASRVTIKLGMRR